MKKLRSLLPVFLVLTVLSLGIPSVYGERVNTHPVGSEMTPPNGDDTGYWCDDCHLFESGGTAITTPGVSPWDTLTGRRWVKTSIPMKPPHAGETATINYPPESTTQVNLGTPDYNGPCEACHFDTTYHCNEQKTTGDDCDHTHQVDNEEFNCVGCHAHFQEIMFGGAMIGRQAHYTHLAQSVIDVYEFVDQDGVPVTEDPKGPALRSCFFSPDGQGCHSSSSVAYPQFGSDNSSIHDTDVCDTCHSPSGYYDGVGKKGPDTNPDYPKWVAYGAKYNWINGIYDDYKGESLQAGKKKWCVGCHDAVPSVIDTGGSLACDPPCPVSAPNVGGDGAVFGYWVSGHGRGDLIPPDGGYANGFTCGGTDPEYLIDGCHNLQGRHIDGDPRTYQVDETLPTPAAVPGHTYVTSYRLNKRIDVPRTTTIWPNPGEYFLCTQCHDSEALMGSDSLFKHVYDPENLDDDVHLHFHLSGYVYPQMTWDSDNDKKSSVSGEGDSAMTCPTCHDPHGSAINLGTIPDPELYPNPVMVRDGHLTPGPGNYGLMFRWYDAINGLGGGGDPVINKLDSRSGQLYTGPPSCAWQPCHETLPFYNRDARGESTMIIDAVWLSDTDVDNTPKSTFQPGDPIRVHVNVRVQGPDTYYLYTYNPKTGMIQSGKWVRYLPNQTAWKGSGTYLDVFSWDEVIPDSPPAVDGGAKAGVFIALFDDVYPGPDWDLITTRQKVIDFTIVVP